MKITADLKADQNLLKILREFDIAVANHTSWLKRVNRSLVCDEAPCADDLTEDAHLRCKFGRWFHEELVHLFQHDPRYTRIRNLHEKMHDQARAILLQRRDGRVVRAAEYDLMMDRAIEFKHEVRTLQFDIINKVCLVDNLTGIWNRYAMFHNLSREHERLLRTGQACCLCMVDIDHFKRINDEYNHHTGDHVLQQFTIALSAGLRRYDSLARFGGEEFLITMPHTGLDKAMKILERLRTNLEAHPLPWKGGRSIAVTASFGLTEMTAGISIEEALERADHALLCAKATGRNRVCVWGG